MRFIFSFSAPKHLVASVVFQDVHVFALEKESTEAGHRVYLVTSYSELWHYYR